MERIDLRPFRNRYRNHPWTAEVERLKKISDTFRDYRTEENQKFLESLKPIDYNGCEIMHHEDHFELYIDFRARWLSGHLSKVLGFTYGPKTGRHNLYHSGIGKTLRCDFEVERDGYFKLKMPCPVTNGTLWYTSMDEKYIDQNMIERICEKLLFETVFCGGHGRYGRRQIELGLDKRKFLTRLYFERNHLPQIKGNMPPVEKYVLVKWVKKKFNLVFNEYMSESFIVDAVNKIGRSKTVKRVFSFDTSGIDYSEDIDSIESQIWAQNSDPGVIYV